jgi:hypothetical protein
MLAKVRDRLKARRWKHVPLWGITKHLLVVNEGKDFKGRKIDFLCPHGTTRQAVVLWRRGFTDNGKTEFIDRWKK